MSSYCIFKIHLSPTQRVKGLNVLNTASGLIELLPEVDYIDTWGGAQELKKLGLTVEIVGDLEDYHRILWRAAVGIGTPNLMIFADCGIGDLVAAEPAFRMISANNGFNLTVVCRAPRQQIIANSAYFKVDTFPLLRSKVEKGAPIGYYSGIPPANQDHNRSMMTIAFDVMGISAGDNPLTMPHVECRQADLRLWAEKCEELRRPLIGVAIAAAVKKRSIPPYLLAKWIPAIIKATGGTVILLGTESQYHELIEPLHPLINHSRLLNACGVNYDPLDLAALISQLNVLITPDTAALHIAGAVTPPIPTIGITAVYPPVYAGGAHPLYYGISPEIDCSPCRDHSHGVCRRSGTNIPPCYERIPLKTVLSTVREALQPWIKKSGVRPPKGRKNRRILIIAPGLTKPKIRRQEHQRKLALLKLRGQHHPPHRKA